MTINYTVLHLEMSISIRMHLIDVGVLTYEEFVNSEQKAD